MKQGSPIIGQVGKTNSSFLSTTTMPFTQEKMGMVVSFRKLIFQICDLMVQNFSILPISFSFCENKIRSTLWNHISDLPIGKQCDFYQWLDQPFTRCECDKGARANPVDELPCVIEFRCRDDRVVSGGIDGGCGFQRFYTDAKMIDEMNG